MDKKDMLASNAMGLTVAADLLNKVIFYIPNVVVAIFSVAKTIFLDNIRKSSKLIKKGR